MESTSLPTPPHWTEPGTYDSVVVAGPDAGSYLQSQVSQELRDLEVGQARWSFVLEPTGRIDVLARIVRVGEEEYRLDTDAGFGDVLAARIDRFKIRVRAETTAIPAQRSASGVDEEARIRAGWPKMGAEIVPGETIPGQTGITTLAVNFTKGCYPGQELVERMDSRAATAPTTLRRLHVDHGAAPGDPIVDGSGATVGSLTSVAGTDALGYVKRGVEIGEPVEAAAG